MNVYTVDSLLGEQREWVVFSLSLGYIRQEPHTALTDKIMGEKRRVAIPGVSLREGGAVLLLFLFARHSVPVLVPVRASPVPSVVRGSFDLCGK